MEPFSEHFLEFHPVHGANVRLDPSGTEATRVDSFANGVCFSREPLRPGQIFLVEIQDKEPGWCGHLRLGLTSRDPRGLQVVPEYSIPDLTDAGDSWVFAITRNHNKVTQSQTEEEAPGGGAGGAGGRRLGRGEDEGGEGGAGGGAGGGEGAGGGDGGSDGGGDGGGEGGKNQKPRMFFTDTHLHIESVRIPRDQLVGRSRPGRFSHILDDLFRTNALPATARRSRVGVLFVPRGPGVGDMHMVINGEDMGPSARGIPTLRPLYAVVDVFAATKRVRIVQVEYGFASLQTLCRKVIQKHIVHRMAIDWLELPDALKHYCQYE